MAVRNFDDLHEGEQNTLNDAWVAIFQAIQIYEHITGAVNLGGPVGVALWQEIEDQVKCGGRQS